MGLAMATRTLIKAGCLPSEAEIWGVGVVCLEAQIHPKSRKPPNTVFTGTFSKSSCELLPAHESGPQQKLFRKTCSDELLYVNLGGFFGVDLPPLVLLFLHSSWKSLRN